MMLFDNTEIFSSGRGGKRLFDVPDADLMLITNFFSKEESNYYYNYLYHNCQWREYEMPMYDKVVTAPRMIAWYGETSRAERKSNPDKTSSSNKDMNIASVTFGETRLFRLRHKFLKHIPQIEIPLYHGTFLLMAGHTNTYWEHQVPKTARQVLPRINLTFRQVKEN